MKRSEMMEDCPEEFEERLKEIIDHIEEKVNDIKDKINIGGINEINRIEDGFSLIVDLAEDLY